MLRLFIFSIVLLISTHAIAESQTVKSIDTSSTSHAALRYLQERFLDLSRDKASFAASKSAKEVMLAYDSATNTTRFVLGTSGLTIGAVLELLSIPPMVSMGSVHGWPAWAADPHEPESRKALRQARRGLGRITWVTGIIILADALLSQNMKSSFGGQLLKKIDELSAQFYSSFEIREAHAATLSDYFSSPEGFPKFLALDSSLAHSYLNDFPKLSTFVIEQARLVNNFERKLTPL